MSSEKNAYAEMPVTQKVYKLETPQLVHQPMIVAVLWTSRKRDNRKQI